MLVLNRSLAVSQDSALGEKAWKNILACPVLSGPLHVEIQSVLVAIESG